MDVRLVKREVDSNGGRLLGMATCPQDSGHETVKSIKRRRREPAFLATATDRNGEIIDQSATSNSTVKRSSRFRGVSRHRWTGRYEAHLWDKGSWNATQRKKGKQVYLGAYDEEEAAARAYDLAALKYWGPTTFTNFPIYHYEKELHIMQNMTKEEYLASLRRKSSGFSRGISKYRGVARHHHNGRWEARIGRVFGNKYLYLGTYSTQEEAAHAYDIAAIEYRGINAVTNFDLSTYIRWLRPGVTNSQNDTPVHHLSREVHAEQPLTNLFATAESGILAPGNPFVSEDMILSSCKQELVPHEFPSGGSNGKSSPTALSLLFKSSMFRQLVEKNSNAPNVGFEGEDIKDQRQRLGANSEYHQIFYEGIADASYGYSPNGENSQGMELQDSISYYDQREQDIWNGVVNVASLQ